MEPTRFDQATTGLAGGISRRRVLQSLGAAALAGMPWSGRDLASSAARIGGVAATARPSAVLPPIPVPLHPVPLGGDTFLMNGRVVAVDLDVASAAFRAGVAVFPIEVDEATFFLTPALLAATAETATPVVTMQPTPPPLPEGPRPAEILESTCGVKDDSQDVEQYNGNLGVTVDFVQQHQPMVGVLRWRGDLRRRYEDPGNVNGIRWCSGTLIADDLFLTAGHCITPWPVNGAEVPRNNVTHQPIADAEIATNMRVEFDFQLDPDGNERPTYPVDVVQLVEHEWSLDRDFTILRLAGNPGQRYGTARLSAAALPADSQLCVISHPGGQEKRVSAGTTVRDDETWLYYRDVDTNYGSSGAGVLASAEGALVGVHTTGGCGEVSAENLNHGNRIAALLHVSPTLRCLCHP